MKKLLLVLLMFVGMSVSCEKENWFSPEEVDEIRSEYQEQINALTILKNELLSQSTSLTTQIDDLNATVTSLGVTNDDQLAEISTLTTSIDSLNTQVTTLDAEITTLTASNTDLTSQISTLNTEVTSLTTSATTLQASLDAALVDILILQDFKSIRDKLDTMVAATISDANLNLHDILIIQNWVDYAKGIGDPSVHLLNQNTLFSPTMFKTAKTRLNTYPW